MISVVKHLFALLLGFVIGIGLASYLFQYTGYHSDNFKYEFDSLVSDESLYDLWFRSSGLRRSFKDSDVITHESRYQKQKRPSVKTEADYLLGNVSVICAVFVTSRKNSYVIDNTWGKHCNKLHYFGEGKKNKLEVLSFKSSSSWVQLCGAIRYIWSIYRYSIQWVFIVPDDVFVIPENLRYVLATKNYSKPHYIGHKSIMWNQVFHTKKAGYVLSQGAVRLFVDKFDEDKTCQDGRKSNNMEDYYLGLYLSELGVTATAAFDDKGRERFHFFSMLQLLAPGNADVLQKHSKFSMFPPVQGPECCSDTSITFRGIDSDLAQLYTYLLYYVRRSSSRGNNYNNLSRVYTPMDHVWKSFVAEELGNHVDPNTISAEKYFKLWTKKVEPETMYLKLKKYLFSSNEEIR